MKKLYTYFAFALTYLTTLVQPFQTIAQNCPYNRIPDTSSMVIDGSINCLMKYKDKLYVGGDFNYMGTLNNGLAVVDTNGQTIQYPISKDQKDAFQKFVSDHQGGVFAIGYEYPSDGKIVSHIHQDGSITAWNHQFTRYNNAMGPAHFSAMVTSNDYFIAIGEFDSVDGTANKNMAAINLHSGIVKPINIAINTSQVEKMWLAGNKLYVSGSFDSIGGQARHRLAAIDTGTWTLSNWNAHLSEYASITTITGNASTIYILGGFDSIMSQRRNGFAAIDAIAGTLKPFNPNINGGIQTMEAKGNTLYVAGFFYDIDGVPRGGLAAFDINTGNLTPWNPIQFFGNPYQVNAICIQNNTVYIGGDFRQINGQSRLRLAAFDIQSGALTEWDPRSSDIIYDITPATNRLFLSGELKIRSTGGFIRKNLMAFDTLTFQLTNWNPNWNQFSDAKVFRGVRTMTHIGDTIYIGGGFDSIGGYKRSSLAAIDAINGSVLNWSANTDLFSLNNLDGVINTICVRNNILYVGGAFNYISGMARNHVAAVNAITGIIEPFNLNINNGAISSTNGRDISTLFIDSNILYIGGSFSSMLGQNRSRLAAVDLNSNTLTSWNPSPNDYITTITKLNNKIWVGGHFDSIASVAQSALAIFDRNNRSLSPLKLDLDQYSFINYIYNVGGTLFLGGYIHPNNFFRYPSFYQTDTLLNPIYPNDYYYPDNSSERNAILDVNGYIYTGGGNSYSSPINNALSRYSHVAPTIPRPSGITNICRNGNTQLDVYTGRIFILYTLQWQKNHLDIPNANSASLQLTNVTPTDTGWYQCIATTLCGSIISDSVFLSVIDSSVPTVDFTINDSIQCLTHNSFEFTAQASVPTGTISYLWNFGNGYTSSQPDTSIYYTYASHYPITLTASQNGGPCKASITKYVDVLASPQANITTTDPVSLCGNGTVNINANTGNNLMYQWLKNQLAINLADDSTYAANTSGIYNVVVTGDNSCTDTSNSIVVQMNALPSVTLNTGVDSIELNASAITLTGGVPMGGIYSGNGVSNGIFSPAIAGLGIHKITYTYIDANTCSDSSSSDINVYLNTGLANLIDTKQILLYPNPANEKLIISIPTLSANAELNITDMYGKSILQTKVNSSNLTIDLSTFIPATYCVVVTDQERVYTSHFVKISK